MAAPLLQRHWPGLTAAIGMPRRAANWAKREAEIGLRGIQAKRFALKIGAQRGRRTCHATDEVKSPVGR